MFKTTTPPYRGQTAQSASPTPNLCERIAGLFRTPTPTYALPAPAPAPEPEPEPPGCEPDPGPIIGPHTPQAQQRPR